MTSGQGSQGTVGHEIVTVLRTPRPLLTPDAFDGDNSWDKWISHFDSVTRVNEWKDEAKLLWLEVRLVGKARKAWNCLTTEEKSNYNSAVVAP